MTVEQLDYQILDHVHRYLHTDWGDKLLPIMRNAKTWTPVYLMLIAYVIYAFRQNAWRVLLFICLCGTLTDVTSSHIIKKTVKRLRPCRNTDIEFTPLIACSQGYSFPSSHAANHFGLSAALSLSIFRRKSWIKAILYFWATLIAFSQVYVGVHYGSDILFGALLGIVISHVLYRYWPQRLSFH